MGMLSVRRIWNRADAYRFGWWIGANKMQEKSLPVLTLGTRKMIAPFVFATVDTSNSSSFSFLRTRVGSVSPMSMGLRPAGFSSVTTGCTINQTRIVTRNVYVSSVSYPVENEDKMNKM